MLWPCSAATLDGLLSYYVLWPCSDAMTLGMYVLLTCYLVMCLLNNWCAWCWVLLFGDSWVPNLFIVGIRSFLLSFLSNFFRIRVFLSEFTCNRSPRILLEQLHDNQKMGTFSKIIDNSLNKLVTSNPPRPTWPYEDGFTGGSRRFSVQFNPGGG